MLRILLGTAALTGLGAAGFSPSASIDSARATSESSVQTRIDLDQATKLRGDLAEILADTDPTGLVSASIVLRAQADRDAIDHAARIHHKPDRRAAVIDILQNAALQSQTDLLAFLRLRQATDEVGDDIRALWIHSVVVVQATPGVIRQIAARDDVAYLHALRDRPGETVFTRTPATPLTGSYNCGIQVLRAPEVWDELGITGAGVTVGIIDSGCCIQHPDLANQVWNNDDEIPNNNIDDDNNGYVDDTYGWNFRDNNPTPIDDINHGTPVSGHVAGDGTNGTFTGMAPDVDFITLKIKGNFSSEPQVWASMEYCVDNGAHIVTASLGWPHGVGPDRATWRMVCENTIAAGLVVLYAAGNYGTCCPPVDNVLTPGDVPDVITIGATNCSDVITGFSSRGPVTWENVPPYNDWPYPPGKVKPTVSAPGEDIVSTINDCVSYGPFGGTSGATPHVSGAAALMLSANPNLDHFDVKQILADTSVDLGAKGWDNEYGAGRVDAFEAVLLALEMTTPCPWDLDNSGSVGAADLLGLLVSWGPCKGCPADFDGNGNVGASDLLALLVNWGPCP